MNEPASESSELFELLAGYCENRLDDEQARRLAGILDTDPAARRAYAEYLQVHHGLHWLGAEPNLSGLESILKPRAFSLGRVGGWGRGPAWGLLAAAALLIAALLAVARFGSGPAAPPHGIAVVTRVADARWGEGSLPVEVGSPLRAGRLVLEKGLVQIEFYSGATVILEGPAELDLVSESRAFCHRGRIRSHVPPHAQGFTIGSPGADVVDLGTEFGLHVDPQQGTEVHVFDGQVELHAPGSAGPVEPLAGGSAVRIAEGRRDAIALNAAAFAGPDRIADLAGEGAIRRYDRWREYSDRLRRDADLVLYYDFERQGAWGRTLANTAIAETKATDGAIVGCAWVPGRWAGKRALEFKRPSDRVLIDVPGSYESISIATWVRFDGLDHAYNAILHTDGWSRGDVHTHIEPSGQINIDFNRRERLSSQARLSAADLGRWVHLAWVYDQDRKAVKFYLDGREDASMPIQSSGPIEFGSAQVGNWNASHRNLNGQMDELAIFGRALSAEEVRLFYEAGRPH